ncbi:GTP pyrophosphokinase family protein [Fibrobacter sp. UWP2]|uniref:GTP pyrophosphokinase n=1 Tax=Fibrobacter sp. UWP2 TaxID=1896216 RepID=UPI00091F28C4|nr:(p)ppGpp synthetase [Fibrobacter sp. UWP2]SHI55383.1 ppGpp synthetase catalytic domain-containing protein (RelA/SpoT-type nucleotidyltranferase) [Fibrobacter sp. UWP2]
MNETSVEKYGLNPSGTMIVEEFRELHPMFEAMLKAVRSILKKAMADNHLYVNAIEARIKDELSLVGKLERKGDKYRHLSDLTDILGARIISFYSDEVDKIAAIVDRLFEVDWENSIDKRKMHEIHSFGYSSLHYICRIPKSLYEDPNFPELNEYRFEIQMRTALQHVWSVLDHDTGYKSGFEIPQDYLRNLNRLAGMLELVDEQFCQIRTGINEYRRQVQALVHSGRFEEVSLDGDSFANYLKLKPFDSLNKRIASINQAEIFETSLMLYLKAFKFLRFNTLGDIEKMIKECSEDAFQLAAYQLGNTDLDIINSSVGVVNLLAVYVLKRGAGVAGLTMVFDEIYGSAKNNAARAEIYFKNAKQLSFMKNV